MYGFIKRTFIVMVVVLLGFGGSLATKCTSMNNQSCMVRITLTDLNPDEFESLLSMFVSLDRCDKSCNTIDKPFGRICLPNKMENDKSKK